MTVRSWMLAPTNTAVVKSTGMSAVPVRLPAGSRIRISGGFDNSRWNPFNPDAKSRVRFGEQTDDEMFIGYINYSEVP